MSQKIWWCNQGNCWKGERANNVVCSSATAIDLRFRSTVGEVKKNDITVHYVKQKKSIVAVSLALEDGRSCNVPANVSCEYGEGWMFSAKYYDLLNPIHRDSINKDILALGLSPSPIRQNGWVALAYFIPFSIEGLRIIRSASPAQWPDWLPL